MFDLVFNAMMAWNQIGMLIITLVFMAIGGVMVGYTLYWKMKAKKIRGRIKAVHVTGADGDLGNERLNRISKKLSSKEKAVQESKPPGKVAYAFFIGFPMIFVCIGLYMGASYFSLKFTGSYADATVIRNDSSYDSENGTSYKAVLSFTDAQGQTHEVRDNISYGSSPSYDSGTRVGVYYRAANPDTFVIADFWHNMGISLAFIGIGSAFICFMFFAMSQQAKQVEAEKKAGISGVDIKSKNFANEMYYALYEYQDSQGSYVESLDGSGSSTLTNKIPGSSVSLLMMPGSSDVTRLSLVIPIIGLIFMGVSVFVGSMFLEQFDYNPFVFIFAIIGLGFVSFRIRRAILKIPAKERKEMWAALRSKNKEDKADFIGGQKQNKGRPLDEYEIMVRLKYHRKQERVGAYVGLVIALCLLGGAYYLGQDMLQRTQQGVIVSGVVTDITSRRDRSSSSNNVMYYSKVEFKDIEGKKRTFKDSFGASYPLHKQDQSVNVLYNPNKPSDAMIDRGIWNWGISSVLAGLAILMTLLSLKQLGSGGSAGRYRRRM